MEVNRTQLLQDKDILAIDLHFQAVEEFAEGEGVQEVEAGEDVVVPEEDFLVYSTIYYLCFH